ncbi:MAG: hypothetical protein PVF33_03540, partial [Candidatus Latescibacterota bacterium]
GSPIGPSDYCSPANGPLDPRPPSALPAGSRQRVSEHGEEPPRADGHSKLVPESAAGDGR